MILTRSNRSEHGDKRKSFMPARGIVRRQQDESGIWEQKAHLSTSLKDSQRWYSMQVQRQMNQGGLFDDPFLSADSKTIGPHLMAYGGRYEWRRPHEIVSNPMFVADGISRFDVNQGEIGDCWFLAAVASLSMHEDLLKEVIPAGQSFNRGPSNSGFTYCGMFWFRIWRFGNWYDVVVDDRLPTRNGRLVFMHSVDRKEFWSALLEKAFVKLVGSYDAMRGGCTSEAMEDFTGGLTEVVDLGEKTPRKLFSIMESAQARNSLMACSIDAVGDKVEAEGPMGLITGHAYSITDVRKVNAISGTVELVRLRNPWGNEKEWRGPWGDQSSEWRSIPAQERKRIGLTFENDGEFWMSFTDFTKYFSRLEFCHLGPESGAYGLSKIQYNVSRRWEMTVEEGEWVKYTTAGGCRNNADTFHKNPQFRVRVVDPDERDDENCGTIIVGLMQKGRRETQQDLQTIGYAIYKLPNNETRSGLLGKAFFLANSTVARSPVFTNMREVVGRHKLLPGEYVIVPSTYAPNEEAKFMLRIFSEKTCYSNEIDDATSVAREQPATPSKPHDAGLIEKLQLAFNDISGPAGILTYVELQDILNAVFAKDFDFGGFSSEACRSMVALMDTDLRGSLDFNEFKKLWMDLRVWRSIFKKFDRNGNGTLDAFELREILKTVGFSVSNRVYQAMVCRYTNRKGEILFDDYILLLVRLVTVVETYNAQDKVNDGRAIFDLEEFTRSVIYI